MPRIVDSIESLLELDEGRKDTLYKDSLGYWTYGVGHMCDPRKGGRFHAKVVDMQLTLDIADAQAKLSKYTWFRWLSPVRQAACVSMIFNLGSLHGWPVLRAQLARGDFKEAAENMRTSQPWASQVGDRAKRLADMIESDKWPVVEQK